jgi:hypothetical protein
MLTFINVVENVRIIILLSLFLHLFLVYLVLNRVQSLNAEFKTIFRRLQIK